MEIQILQIGFVGCVAWCEYFCFSKGIKILINPAAIELW